VQTEHLGDHLDQSWILKPGVIIVSRKAGVFYFYTRVAVFINFWKKWQIFIKFLMNFKLGKTIKLLYRFLLLWTEPTRQS